MTGSYYPACQHCSAKWSSVDVATVCPRCGGDVALAIRQTRKPWQPSLLDQIRSISRAQRFDRFLQSILTPFGTHECQVEKLRSAFKVEWHSVRDADIGQLSVVLHRRRDTTNRLIRKLCNEPSEATLKPLLNHLRLRTSSQSVVAINHVHRFVIRTLRHTARKNGIRIDRDGWGSIDSLLRLINSRPLQFQLWRDWTVDDLDSQVSMDDFNRLSIDAGFIRANYGHSIDGVLPGFSSEPPLVLYHGTNAELLPDILSVGLHANRRYLVHLTSSQLYASEIASHFIQPAVLQVDTDAAITELAQFWKASSHVWQCTQVSDDCLELAGP